MKKLLCSLMTFALALTLSLSSVLGYDTTKIDSAYNAVVNYYKSVTTLDSPDEIIAVEALGLEAEDGYTVPDFASIDYSTATIGDLTKSIVALTLMKQDPKNVKGQNLVAILESYIQDDGSVVSGSYETDAGYLAWVAYALLSVQSDKANLVLNYLATTENTNVNYGDGGFTSYGASNPDVTGWCIEVLAISGKYQDRIDNALEYLKATMLDDAAFNYYGANADTQSSVLQGLFVVDKENVLNDNWNKNDNNPIDVLLTYQKDGYFVSEEYDDQWNPTGQYKFNAYTTMEAARCLGTYKNGSFVYKAQQSYQSIQQTTETPVVEQPVQNEQPVENTTDEKTTSVKTGDDSSMILYGCLVLASGGVFVFVKKNEEVCW